MDPTRDNAGEEPSVGPRHHDGTINEAGTPGFAIDGTDSFAVPDPEEGLSGGAEAVAGAPWRRLLVTLGALVILLAVVVTIGSTGHHNGNADSLRTTSGTTPPDFTLPSPFGGPATDRSTDTAPSGSEETTVEDTTMSTYGDVTGDTFGDYQSSTGTASTEDPYRGSDTYVPKYQPYIPPSRIVPPVTTRTTPRTTPRTTATTAPPSTTQPADTATTVADTTTTTTTTTQPPAAPAAWQRPTTPPAVTCADAPVRVWSGEHSMLAGVGSKAWQSADGGQTWTEVPGVSEPTAFADVASGPAWIGSPSGVTSVGGGSVPAGALTDVTSLSAVAAPTGPPTLFAVSKGTLQRSVAGAAWEQVAVPTVSGFGEVLAIDDQHFLLATSTGVVRGATDGSAPAVVSDAAVVEAPARQGRAVWWLRSDHMVVHGTTDSTTRWAVGGGAGVDPNVMSLVALPGGKILTAGVNDRLIESGDGGATWAPFADQPPYRPAGVARDSDSGATVVWATGCASGTADPADSVLRHVDG